jgi:hypothetical protein
VAATGGVLLVPTERTGASRAARREFQIARRGYDDGLPAEPRQANETSGEREDRRTGLQPYLDERDTELAGAVQVILDVLEVPEPREDTVVTLIALVEGLTLSACLGRITPQRATDLAVAHVLSLSDKRRDAGGRL